MHDKLKEARISNNLSQAEVSEATGITISMLSRYENGHVEPMYERLIKLCKLYGVTPNDILL